MPLISNKEYVFYIYALYEPETPSAYFYIGRTVNPESRLYDHNNVRAEKGLAVASMLIIASTDTNEKCALMERHYIHQFLQEGHRLVNRNHREHTCWPGCPAVGKNTRCKRQPDLPVRMRCESLTKKGVRCGRTTISGNSCEVHRTSR